MCLKKSGCGGWRLDLTDSKCTALEAYQFRLSGLGSRFA